MKYRFSLYCNLPNDSYDGSDFVGVVSDIGRYADQYGYEGILFHFNHRMMDPFILGSQIIQNTRRLSPIIAVQPPYASPVSTAKMIQGIAYLYGRKVVLNMITGAAPRELEHIHEQLDHDQRYARLAEFIEALKLMLRSDDTVTYEGSHYRYTNLELKPVLPPALMPEFFVAGASAASTNLAVSHADVFITHPEPAELFEEHFAEKLKPSGIKIGIKIGVIARETREAAWEIAKDRYPQSSRGKIITRMKIKSESEWLRQMALLGTDSEQYDQVYWMGGFNSGVANNPILVGSYQDVAEYMERYLQSGVSVVIAAGIYSEDDFAHANEVFRNIRAEEQPDAEDSLKPRLTL